LGSSARKLKSMDKTTPELGSKGYSNADQKSSELAREKMWSRIHLIPVLQAEEDRDLVRRHWAQEAREKELLGAETKVYNNDRCVLALCCRNGTVQGRCTYGRLTMETGSCVPRTRLPPARPRNRARRVRRQG
jgi:hypothetical protein